MTTETPGPDLSGQTIRKARFTGATLIQSSFQDATIEFSNLSGANLRSVDVDGLRIDSHDLFFGSLFVNGVDVVPLVKAELNRQFPGRELQDAQDSEGLRKGWEAVQAAWAQTVAETPADLRDATIDGEWSLAQTLRHLVLATDCWLRGAIQGEAKPFHEIGQVFTGGEQAITTTTFRPAKDFDEILAVRAERQQMVTDFLAQVTPEQLGEERQNPWDPDGDWKPTVGDCVRTILEEEWAHLRYIRRDLAKIEATP